MLSRIRRNLIIRAYESIPNILEYMLLNSNELFASKLRSSQIAKDPDFDQVSLAVGAGVTTVYISANGDDLNDGLTQNTPKRTLAGITAGQNSNRNILLRCGDEFKLDKTISLGSNTTLAYYGKGERPILNYFTDLNVVWALVDGYTNVWGADLSTISSIVNGSNTNNCDIGLLLINGEYSWKRKCDWIGNPTPLDYPNYLFTTADGSWAIDWTTSKIWIYSNTNPNTLDIKYASPVHGLTVSGSNVGVYGIEITGVSRHGISLSNINNCVIRGCYIHHIGGACMNGNTTKYGNAIEVWDNGSNILVEYNIARWIYDTCYTNQGTGTNIVQKNIIFRKNIGEYSFWGLESWGDYTSNDIEGSCNILYENNIIMNLCDVTNPTKGSYIDSSGRLYNELGIVNNNNPPYITYRTTSYPYHQMSGLNASGDSISSLWFKGNVFWNTKRFIYLVSNTDSSKNPKIIDNLFYVEVPNVAITPFRVKMNNGSSNIYSKECPVEGNTTIVVLPGTESQLSIISTAKLNLLNILQKMLNKNKTLSSISATKTKKDYIIGGTLTIDDITVTATYSDSTKATVIGTIDSSSVNMSTSGTYNIVISYTEEGAIKNTTIPITVSSSGSVVANGKVFNNSQVAIGTWTLNDGGELNLVATTGGAMGNLAVTAWGWYPYLAQIKKVNIGSGFTYVGGSAFKGYTALTSVVMADTVVSIGGNAFEGCTKLTTIDLTKLTTINSNGFKGCTSLPEQIVLGSTALATNAFYYTSNIKSIKFTGKPSWIAVDALKNITSYLSAANLKNIYVPWAEGAVADAPWGATLTTITYNYIS